MPHHRKELCGVGLCLAAALASSPVEAHGFGQRYDLPIPLPFYVWGAGATVALSFVGFAFFLRGEHAPSSRQVRLCISGRLRRALTVTARALALCMLLLVIVAGLFGNQDPIRNIAPVMIWVIFWVGVAFLSLFAGNVWAVVNPWNAVFEAVEATWRHIRPAAPAHIRRAYPDWLGAWPAVLLLISFAWLELVWGGKTSPAQLAVALLAYATITWSGMALFGRETWLKHGEVFSLVFGIFAQFAPLDCRDGAGLRLRFPATGLLERHPTSLAVVTLVISLLATVTFDGFLETPLWARVDAAVLDAASEVDSMFWTVLGLREDQAAQLVRTLALVACILLFTTAYAVVCWVSGAISGDKRVRTGLLMRHFVLTLVPISAAYHIAHYFSYLFLHGQYAIPLMSDPLGRGWNLFGTAGYQIDIGLVSPRLQWTVAVVSVVLGHVLAVYLSHVTALQVFHSRRAALVRQIPMVVLMVSYTMLSLWILSQPIVETAGG